MQIHQKKYGEILTLRVENDRIDAASAIEFKDQMRAAAQNLPQRVILDLRNVTFVDSSGLGAIVNAKKTMGAKTQFDLCGLNGAVDKVFKLTRMDSVFDIYSRLDQALTDPETHSES